MTAVPELLLALGPFATAACIIGAAVEWAQRHRARRFGEMLDRHDLANPYWKPRRRQA